MQSSTLLETPLHSWHREHGGKLVDFSGWSMPTHYVSIVAEHQATRSGAALFDISHMGRFVWDTDAALAGLDRQLTRRVAQLRPGQIRYSLITREDGGILDDVLVYHLPPASGWPAVMLVVNAGNRLKVKAWLEAQAGEAAETLRDETLATAMLAVQGPRAVALVDRLSDVQVSSLGYYRGCRGRVADMPAVISRTGYTGEDGCELIVAADAAQAVWQALLEAGAELPLVPAGLGARDTLRLEAGMPLYGHELSESVDPFQAGLAFAVQLEGREFPGHAALQRRRHDPAGPVRVGLVLDEKRVPRQQHAVLQQDREVGAVTSGTFSPTLQRPIAMAYVAREASAVGTSLAIDIRGRRAAATVVELPFYQRHS